MNRMLKILLLLTSFLLTASCGFHLRESAALPPSMKRVHVTVSGGGDLQRKLVRALIASDVTVEDSGGPDVAEFNVPVAAFSSQMLTISGFAQVTEYAVHYHVQFNVKDGGGKVVIPNENVEMQREYSYDASNTVGSQAQVEAIEGSLIDDMIQAMMFRLQAVTKHGSAAAAEAVGSAPAESSSNLPPPVPATDAPGNNNAPDSFGH
jgi:LPS-assembly lipoprotein